MASKSTVRTYRILKSAVRQALNPLAPLPDTLSVESFDAGSGAVLVVLMTDQPSKYVDKVSISVSKAEIANFVNSHVGTSLTANQIANVIDGQDSSFYEVTTT